MKNKLIIFIIITFWFLNSNLYAQIGGNQLYQNKSVKYNRNPVITTSLYSTDSTLIITSKVLMNKKANYYLISVGVNQVGKTVIEANQKSTERIESVIKKIKKLGISNKDIYIDFIAETKLYDHKITDREITEYFDGFSIRKNIIIKVNQLNQIDKIINYCSEEKIYDIIKVDYVSHDLETLNALLLSEALKIVQKKKNVFKNNSSIELSDKYKIASEKFKIYYPKNLYKQYNEAFETSLVNSYYSSNYIKKEVRKERTFYYDGIETEIGIDKIIDNISPIIGIQYILEIKVIYELKK